MAFYDQVDASKKQRLHTERKDPDGNVYVYLKGLTSTAVGSWVAFDELGVTSLLITSSIGPVAIAKAAVDANTKYGWYLVKGTGLGLALTGYADNATVNGTATPGSVDDNAVAAAAELNVFGAWGRSAVNETTLLATFQLNRPEKSLALLD